MQWCLIGLSLLLVFSIFSNIYYTYDIFYKKEKYRKLEDDTPSVFNLDQQKGDEDLGRYGSVRLPYEDTQEDENDESD